jgi:hypothetical protein
VAFAFAQVLIFSAVQSWQQGFHYEGQIAQHLPAINGLANR